MNPIDMIIASNNLYSLDENGRSYQLKNNEVQFIKELLCQVETNRIFHCFRGETISSASEKFGTYDLKTILKYFFLIGDKAAYLHKNSAKNQALSLKKIISELTHPDYKLYFNHVNFENLWSYFTGHEYKLICYYSFLLHVLNKYQDPHYSPLLSTTSNYEISKSFSHNKKPNNPGTILFIVKLLSLENQTSNMDLEFYDILKNLGLPLINEYSYYGEDEINFIYGLYPQSIYAIQDNMSDNIYINPSLLKYMRFPERKTSFFETLEIHVDQVEFFKEIRKTKIHSYVEFDNNEPKIWSF